MLHQPRPADTTSSPLRQMGAEVAETTGPAPQQQAAKPKAKKKKELGENCGDTFWSWAMPSGFRNER